MQDIRQELRDRLKNIQEQREKVQGQLAELEATEKSLVKVLASENALWEKLSPSTPLFQDAEAPRNGSGKLRSVLLDLLRNGEPWTVNQFKSELDKRGYPFGEKAAGRVINFALVGLLNQGFVKNLGEGKWELKQKGGH